MVVAALPKPYGLNYQRHLIRMPLALAALAVLPQLRVLREVNHILAALLQTAAAVATEPAAVATVALAVQPLATMFR